MIEQKKAPAATEAQSDKSYCHNIQLCSGFGQQHTDNPAKKCRKPYNAISLAVIAELAAKPPTVPKENGQWIIPTSFIDPLSRSAEYLRENGKFYAAVVDTDKNPELSFKEKLTIVKNSLPFAVIGWTSRSATSDNQKAHFMIIYGEPIDGRTHELIMEYIHDLLEKAGLLCDRKMETCNQLYYLPNRGEFWESEVDLDLPFLTVDDISEGLHEKQLKQEAAEKDRQARLKESAAKMRKSIETDLLSPIDAFNAAYRAVDLLDSFGGKVLGDRAVSPLSESGNAQMQVMDDGRLLSHHGSDMEAGLGKLTESGKARLIDSVDLIKYFICGNDQTATLKYLGEKCKTSDGISITKHNQRQYMAKQAQELAAAEFDIVANDETLWPDPVDPFVEYIAPPFPLDTLPEAFSTYAREKSEQSGFDVGGYAFCLLVVAGNLIDQQGRLDAGIFHVPPMLWGGLVDSSGGGKTPIFSAAKKFAAGINDDLVKESDKALKEWRRLYENASKEEKKSLPKPPFHQHMTDDTTTEALGALLVDNPRGLQTVQDEITEFIGRMDAYSSGSGKDRGTYLRAFDGGRHTINRKTQDPLVIENFSVGILAGMQPEKLAGLYRQQDGGSDGLFQRFLMYGLAAPGNVNYFSDSSAFADVNMAEIFRRLWAFRKPVARLSGEARQAAQDYHNTIRLLAQRTPGKRFAEHLNKFPGYVLRIAFVLHCLDCAEKGETFTSCLPLGTYQRAEKIMKILYRHSEAIYNKLEQQAVDVVDLMKGACEAILSKGWTELQRGDLTRDATGWKKENDNRKSEAAIDYLIELGWIMDVTPPAIPGRKGRRSDGRYAVNPAVHKRFTEHTARIKLARLERFEAIQKAAAERRNN